MQGLKEKPTNIIPRTKNSSISFAQNINMMNTVHEDEKVNTVHENVKASVSLDLEKTVKGKIEKICISLAYFTVVS